MNEKIEAEARKKIADALPKAIETALSSYQTFMEQDIKQEENGKGVSKISPKAFKDHHDACKVALGHLHLLLKTAHFLGQDEEALEEEEREDLLERIRRAKAEINLRGRKN